MLKIKPTRELAWFTDIDDNDNLINNLAQIPCKKSCSRVLKEGQESHKFQMKDFSTNLNPRKTLLATRSYFFKQHKLFKLLG